MWNIDIVSSADEDLIRYFRLYRDYFVNIFTDTGLWNEDDICKGYELLAFDIIGHIRRGMEERLIVDSVIGWKQKDSEKTLLFTAGKRYVRITYSENLLNKTRLVTGIEIWLKK